jgi:hypothetical protein
MPRTDAALRALITRTAVRALVSCIKRIAQRRGGIGRRTRRARHRERRAAARQARTISRL